MVLRYNGFGMVNNKTSIILFSILLLAAILRFWQLDKYPPGLYPDEAVNGVNALQVLDSADFKVFFTENNGREGLFINLQALSVQLFGATPWALRAVSAFIGTLTVLIFYLLLKELQNNIRNQTIFENRYFALAGAFLLTVNSWHIHFSHLGFRAITLPFLLCLAVLFLLRGIRTRHTKEFIISGFWWGLGFYSYIGFRLAPLLGLIIFTFDSLLWFLRRTISLKKFVIQYVLLGITIIATATPLIGYFITHTQDILSRSAPISVFVAENPLIQLLISAAQTALMFNFIGDWNWRHNVAGAPILTYITGLLFIMGVLAVLKISLRMLKQKSFSDLFPLIIIGGWFIVMLMPAFLTREGMPHALRSIGAIPAVIIFATVGLMWLWKILNEKFSLNHRVSLLLLLIIIAAISVENIHRYFIVWGQNNNLPYAFRNDLVEKANFINALDKNTVIYVVVNEGDVLLDGVPVASATIRFITVENPNTHYLKAEKLDQIKMEADKQTIIIFTVPDDKNLENELFKLFSSVQKIEEQVIYYKLR